MKTEINKKRNQFHHPLIENIKTCVVALLVLVVFLLLYFFLESLLDEEFFKFILIFLGIPAAGAFFYFTTRFIRIIGWFIKKDKWTKFGD